MSVRLDDGLIERLDARAAEQGINRTELVTRLLEHGLKTDGVQTVLLSTSEIACLDQLAERAGCTRSELSRRYLGQRLRREFTDDRHRLLQKVKG
jgi:predicted transcriptional regulator